MATINEDYCSYKVAQLLKEKGFDEEVLAVYIYDNLFVKGENEIVNTANVPIIPAPTLQMAMKWLRKVHNIDIISPPQYDSIKWTYSAIIFKLSIPCTEIRLNDNKDKKEEAYEEAIKHCLENLI